MKRLRSKITKRILGFVLVMGLSGVFFNGYVGVGETAHAQGTDGGAAVTAPGAAASNTPSIDTMSMWQILNIVLKVIYLLLWPLLVVAGLALDNTLVYASVFHLDAPLWKFWNMMKNFANFTLGFMVLFAIIKSIFSNSGAGSAKDEKSPLGIIKTTLIAGVLIQASWFLMAALVDVSTIATYAVGGLPLNVLKNTAIGSQKILTVNSSINLNEFELSFQGGKEFRVWYSMSHKGIIPATDQTLNISPCRVAKNYVIGREFGDPIYMNTTKLNSITEGNNKYKDLEVCVLYGNQLVMWPEAKALDALCSAMDTCYNTGTVGGYTQAMSALTNYTGWDTDTTNANLVNLRKNLVYLGSGNKGIFDTGAALFSGSDALTIDGLIKRSKGFVGPLVTIYSSLLNFSQLSDANIGSAGGTSGIFIIKALTAVALFFPLLALALVLIARVGMLWLYIVASPFIIIKASFKKFIDMKGMDKYLSINGVIGIIFAPVVTVAALSISLIFMTALVNGFKTDSTSINETFNVRTIKAQDPKNDAVSFEGLANLEFSKIDWGGTMDRFSWFMVNFFAIGLMRMIFFAALKANELGKGVGAKVESFGQNVFQTLPIIPIGKDGKGVGIGSANRVIGNVPNTYISNLNSANDQQVSEWMNKGKTEKGINLEEEQMNKTFEILKKSATPTIAQTELDKTYKDLGLATTTANFGTEANMKLFTSKLEGMNAADQTIILSNVPASVKDNYTARLKGEIANKLTINKIQDGDTEEAINIKLGDPEYTKLFNNYFNTNGDNTYDFTVGKKILKIGRPTDVTSPTNKYTGKLETPAAVDPTKTNPKK